MRWVVLSLSLGLMGFTLWVREWAAEEEPLAPVELPAVVAEPLDVRDAGAAPHFDLDDPYCDPIAVSGGWSFGVDEARRVVTVENGRLSMDPWAVRLPGDWIAAMATALETRDVAQQRRLLAVSCAPDWVGGLFDGSIRLTAEDGVPLAAARHETAHAVLNGRIHQRWLSEGLATWFERDPWRYEKIWRAMINQRRWLPPGDLDDALVSSNAVVSQMAYAESLALVMLLERCRGRHGDLKFVRPLVQQGLDAVFKAECRRELTRESFLAGLEQLL